MAVSSLEIAASLDEVRELVLQPEHYSYWVLGPQVVVDVEDRWPAVGSSFTTKVGRGGLELRGRTTLVAAERDRIELAVDLFPFLSGRVEISLAESVGGTQVTLHEQVLGGIAAIGGPLARRVLTWRNDSSLARLGSLLEEHGAVRDVSLRSKLAGAAVFDNHDVASLLSRAEACYLAVSSASGPHVTPTRFATFADRAWLLTGATSVKSASLKKRPVVGMMARAGERSVVIQGEAVVLDPLDPRSWLRPLFETALITPALFRYLVGNVSEIPTWARALSGGLASGSAGGAPALLAVRPIGGMIVGPSGVEATFGRWLGRETGRSVMPPIVTDATLGWTNDHGALALPASWDPVTQQIAVSEAVVDVSEAADATDACFVIDDAAEYKGLMYRGKGSLQRLHDRIRIHLASEKVTYWDGTTTGTSERRREFPGLVGTGSPGRR